ncbi:MAG: tRNA (adenosine(37)-N6)-threonylcarbamoyltransferase complex ATPase subunit type 1 TsaE [Treponema sp.]|jgi:tRNA threonylcarbamoyladenosine biosynthesis protein TsaE|nr:tRNA (adenosine(37)-N6)-threonylcarbamoyltransferase complex ATPase subunit type 1 TsaE [Treponema sp.]
MENSPFNITSHSPEETIAAGEWLASWLHQGSVVALRGGLGVGKTYFTKGIARGLGVQEEVTSPTYTMIAEYQGVLPLYHIDAYRLEGDADFSSLGADEMFYGTGVSVIEWSERIPQSIPKDALIVEITLLEQNHRLITLRNIPE